MPESTRTLVERMAELAERAAAKQNTIRTAVVLATLPDGTLSVDDGQGGCARVAANMLGQRAGCGETIIIGTEPSIGQVTTLCQVQVTVTPSTRPCPVGPDPDDPIDDDPGGEDDVEDVLEGESVFVDDAGNRYHDPTGDFLGTGPDTADVDPAHGYRGFHVEEHLCSIGEFANDYDDLEIGSSSFTSAQGHHGEWDMGDDDLPMPPGDQVQTTALKGVGSSSGLICGIEVPNVRDEVFGGRNSNPNNWRLAFRDPTPGPGFLGLLYANAAAYVAAWLAAHPLRYPLSGAALFDDSFNVFDYQTGAFIEAAGDFSAEVDNAYGYSFDFGTNETRVGASPGYDDLAIGDLDDNSGYQGETYSANNTVLCRGLGVSTGILCGIEKSNAPGITVWTVALRNATTFALIARHAATYISDWMDTEDPSGYPGDNVDYDVNVSADPDGTFWVGLGGNSNHAGAFAAPLFNVSPADGSLIRTVELEAQDQFFQRAGVTTTGQPTVYTMHLSNDPEDDSFWLNMVAGSAVAGDRVPIFNIDPADGSLIRTVELEVPTADFATFLRARRHLNV
jgi:hypothetical protein